jgi:anti-sigma factor RsiW
MTLRSTTCEQMRADISRYLDEELDAPACEAIERHCRDCESCAALVKGLRDTVGLCRHAASAPLPDAVRQRARDSVRRLLNQETKRD